MRLFTAAVALLAAGALVASCPGSARAEWHVLDHPINPKQLSELPFGTRSHWLQPWRSSLTTRPATRLRDAIGINFDVDPSEAAATARLLHDSGFRRARLEIGWDQMSYDDPSRIADPTQWAAYIAALRDNHIRPLILLNANSGGPTPLRSFQVRLTAAAPRGATQVSLDPASAGAVVPNLTGFDTSTLYPGILITHVDGDGIATLATPLPYALHAGPVQTTTLRYEPFAPPTMPGGRPNPRFEQTLTGWLAYAKGVTRFVRDVYGSDDFDVEVWNELSFGSAFLDERNYFARVPDPGATGDATEALLARTVAALKAPSSGVSGVRIGDGFSNQAPWESGALVPKGTAAIDKHPYMGAIRFPQQATINALQPVDALGRLSYTTIAKSTFRDTFIPNYRVLMPEYYLTGIQTETLMRDLSPMTTTVYGVPHGAATHPPGGPPPTMWITEDGLDANQAHSAEGLPVSDEPEFQAKAALRFFTAYASEGVSAIDLYGAKADAGLQLIAPSFFTAVDADPAARPDRLGGAVMDAVQRLVATLRSARPIRVRRSLTLDAIANQSDAAQFAGDRTPAHPALLDRDVLAFFPFQLSATRFVCAVYVMTRDLAHRYTSDPASGATPFDMPEQQYRLTIGGLDGRTATVSLADPLSGRTGPARIVLRSATHIVVQIPVTDSPRMLTISRAPVPQN